MLRTWQLVRHSRESGSPGFSEVVDSRLRGNDPLGYVVTPIPQRSARGHGLASFQISSPNWRRITNAKALQSMLLRSPSGLRAIDTKEPIHSSFWRGSPVDASKNVTRP